MIIAYSPPPVSYGTVFFASAVAIVVFLLVVAFCLWMFVDCLRNELPGSKEKIFWATLILVTGPPGAFIYNIGRRDKRIKLLGK